jgi:hypothetical protein
LRIYIKVVASVARLALGAFFSKKYRPNDLGKKIAQNLPK